MATKSVRNLNEQVNEQPQKDGYLLITSTNTIINIALTEATTKMYNHYFLPVRKHPCKINGDSLDNLLYVPQKEKQGILYAGDAYGELYLIDKKVRKHATPVGIVDFSRKQAVNQLYAQYSLNLSKERIKEDYCKLSMIDMDEQTYTEQADDHRKVTVDIEGDLVKLTYALPVNAIQLPTMDEWYQVKCKDNMLERVRITMKRMKFQINNGYGKKFIEQDLNNFI